MACSIEVKSTNAQLYGGKSMVSDHMTVEELCTYPLHLPLSSKVPMRTFRIHLSFVDGLSSGVSCACSSATGFLRCALSRSVMACVVVSNPRLPKNNVGAGGCFCERSIFCAVLLNPDGLAWDCESAVGKSPVDCAEVDGRPVKSSPGQMTGCQMAEALYERPCPCTHHL